MHFTPFNLAPHKKKKKEGFINGCKNFKKILIKKFY